MKYLLDQEELDALVKRSEVETRDIAIELLRRKIVSEEECWLTRQMRCNGCPLSETQWRTVGRDVATLMCNRKQEFSK